jgi:hypothetical protein
MTGRFLCSDADVGDMSFADVETVLDALEAAVVSADTPLFDAARQSWQPLASHPEVRAAWEARARFRPPGGQGLSLPALPELHSIDPDDEVALRRTAYDRMRNGSLERPAPAPSHGRSFRMAMLLCAAVLLGLVGWAVVSLAVGLSGFATKMLTVSGGK